MKHIRLIYVGPNVRSIRHIQENLESFRPTRSPGNHQCQPAETIRFVQVQHVSLFRKESREKREKKLFNTSPDYNGPTNQVPKPSSPRIHILHRDARQN
jgi:hypothetical protein